jgi:Kef-type K+ transport system membrane component KefB
LQKALGSTLRSSGQLYIRLAVVLIALMAFVANELGLDFLLGAFTAGVLYRIFLLAGAEARERETVESKLEAVTFGYLIPIFFVVTGVQFDLGSLGSVTAILKIPLFLGLFLVVRGLPILLYRKELPDPRERKALALLSATGLPLVVAITTIGVATGQMRTSTEAALVGAAMLSVIVFPMLGMRLAPRARPAATPVNDEEPA